MAGRMGASQSQRAIQTEERRRYPRVEIAWSVALVWGPRPPPDLNPLKTSLPGVCTPTSPLPWDRQQSGAPRYRSP